jgi:hypothetical protein
MRLSPAIFNAQLAAEGSGGMGQRLLWRRASVCPCRSAYSGGADQECPRCRGLGTFWGAAVPAWAGAPGATSRRARAAFGEWEDGDVLLSIPATSPLWAADENDRVVLLQGHEPFQVRRVRGDSDRVDFPVERFERCFWLGPEPDRAVVEGGLPRLDAATGALSWADPDAAPPGGTQYTLQGRRRPEYFLFGVMPVTRAHFGGLPLPKFARLRAFDLFGKGTT